MHWRSRNIVLLCISIAVRVNVLKIKIYHTGPLPLKLYPTDTLPPQNMLDAVQALIAFGVQNGNIDPNYKLLGHRQVRNTECPGDALFDMIKTWPHWTSLDENKTVNNTVPT